MTFTLDEVINCLTRLDLGREIDVIQRVGTGGVLLIEPASVCIYVFKNIVQIFPSGQRDSFGLYDIFDLQEWALEYFK